MALLRHYCAFSLSLLLDQLYFIFSLKISNRFHMGFRSGMLAGQSLTVESWSANNLEVVLALWASVKLLLENEISISIKLVCRWKHKVLQNLLVDNIALTLDLIKHNGPTPEDVTATQIITDFGNVTQNFKQLVFCTSPALLQTLFSK